MPSAHHTTDIDGRAWHIEHTEPAVAGIDVHYGYPADAPRTGPPRVADTPELVAYLWRVSMQDAVRTLPIGQRFLHRIPANFDTREVIGGEAQRGQLRRRELQNPFDTLFLERTARPRRTFHVVQIDGHGVTALSPGGYGRPILHAIGA